MKVWRVDLTCNNQSLGGVLTKLRMVQGDSFLPLLFLFFLFPLTVVLYKSESAYIFKNKGKIIHHLFLGDLKLYAKNEKGPESPFQTVQIFSDDIGMELCHR